MHWADVLARELLERSPAHTLATGITPSGPIHVGNLREVLTTEAVHRAIGDAGGRSTLLYVGDTFDPLRKVYPFLEDHPSIDFAEHVGKPLCEVPCPCGDHPSYAHHFLEPFLTALDELGVEPTTHLAHELYGSGAYQEAIVKALDGTQRIREVLEGVSGRELPVNWLPLNVRCTACGRITGSKPLLYEFPELEYRCDCGHEGRVDVRTPGVGKLPWRIDWPARWSFLGVTFEAFGKDHAASGGSWDTGVPIAREIFGIEPPHHTVYEFINVKGGGAMHSSTGTAVAAEAVLQVTPPEVLRFFFHRYQPNKHIEFDPGLGLLDLVDEYDRILTLFHETGDSAEVKDVDRVLTLAQPSGELPEHPGQSVGMRHLSGVVQVYDDLVGVLASLERSGHVTELEPRERRLLEHRVARTKAWLSTFAPESVTFEVPEDVPADALDEDDRAILAALAAVLEATEWEAQAVHDAVYAAAEKAGVGGGRVFKAAYRALIGRDRGPRLGAFLASLEKTWVVARFEAAAST